MQCMYRLMKMNKSLCNVACLFLLLVVMIWLKDSMNSKTHIHDSEEPLERSGRHSGAVDVAVSDPDSEFQLPSDPFAASLIKRGKTYCDSNFIAFGKFAKVKNIIINPAFGKLTSAVNSKIGLYNVLPGFFMMNCNDMIDVTLTGTHLNSWTKAIKTGSEDAKNYETVSDWTIAISRNHNENLYYTMLDIYNAYLLCRAFDLHPKTVNILFIDGLPEMSTNSTWKTLFRQVHRIQEIKKPVMYKNMIWGLSDSESPLNSKYKLQSIPNLESFRKFFLSRHNLDYNHKKDCKKLNMLFMNKFDAVIDRKTGHAIENIREDRFYPIMMEIFSDHKLQSYKTLGSLQDKIEDVSKADILVSIHREELVNILFLPEQAIVFEVFPTNYSLNVNNTFQTLAKWRNLNYHYWEADTFDLQKSSLADALPRELGHIAAKFLRQLCFQNNFLNWN